MRWHQETNRWVDACIKTAVSESPANQALIAGWIDKWRSAWNQALQPIAVSALGTDADASLAAVNEVFDARLKKLRV